MSTYLGMNATADRLIGNDHAAFLQHFFNMTKAQRKTEIQPDCMGDDFGRKTLARVTESALL